MTLFDKDSFREIGATLSRNKTRTFLTAFGIFWGTLMLSLLWGGGQGARRMMYSNFEGIASNMADIGPRRTTMPYKGYKKGMYWTLNNADVVNLRRRVPELETVSPMVGRYSSVRYRKKGKASQSNYHVVGADAAYRSVMNPVMVAGRFITDTDVSAVSKVCVIGAEVANALFGNDEPLGKIVDIDNYNLRVVGVVADKSDMSFGARISSSVFLPISTARSLYHIPDRVDELAVVAKSGYRPGDLRDKIYQVISSNHPQLHPDDKDNMWFWDTSEMFEQIDNVFSGLDFLILFVGFSSLLAGIIGVGNIMWIVVKERTKEFGIRRAIGAKPGEVMRQILAESAVLTVVSGMLAVVVSVGILAGATMLIRQTASRINPEQINFQLSFGSAVVILLLFIVLGCLVGTIPALKAMRIKPIEALNDK